MSRVIIRPSQERFDRLALRGVRIATVLALFVTIFQLGAWYQRNNVAVGHYCNAELTACRYEADFTN